MPKSIFGGRPLDDAPFLVYFYTRMQHEMNLHRTSLPNTYAIPPFLGSRPGETHESLAYRANVSAGRRSVTPLYRLAKIRSSDSHEVVTRALEVLLGALRGESLVIAMLAYGLGVRVSELKRLRLRDICLRDGSILIAGCCYTVPGTVLEDLREHLHQRICGREARLPFDDGGSGGSWLYDDQLFSSRAFDLLCDVFHTVKEQTGLCRELGLRSDLRIFFDSAFKALARAHKRQAARFGRQSTSALELLDKGPRIVRRGRGGTVDSYYVWKAARELLAGIRLHR
ncbi:MAG: hypothetical protein ACK5GN_13960 [Pseudomonadota bacterium]|jgi:hypothetical protein